MHQFQDIEKLSELKCFFTRDQKAGDTFVEVLSTFFNAKLSRLVAGFKADGYGAEPLLGVLLLMPLLGVSSVWALVRSGCARLTPAQKDAFYRLKNKASIDWRLLLYRVAQRFRALTRHHGESSDQPHCAILDDTTLAKTSWRSEGVSKVFDHVSRRYLWGFKLLVLGIWDGKSFCPVDFTLHREAGRNKKRRYGLTRTKRGQQYSKSRAPHHPGSKRTRELDSSKAVQAVALLRRALWRGLSFDYVLTDSWFFSASLLTAVRSLAGGRVHLVAMAKMGTARYTWQGGSYTPAQLKQRLKAQRRRCRSLNAHYMRCSVDYKGIPVTLFLVRYAGQGRWRLVVCSDRSLSFIQAMRLYSRRWSIEVFFKEAKQHLQLGTSQAWNLDGQIADITLAMIRYTLLSFRKRFTAYETLGELFAGYRQQLLALTIAEQIWGLILQWARQLCKLLEVSPDWLLDKLIRADSHAHWKIVELLRPLAQPPDGGTAAQGT